MLRHRSAQNGLLWTQRRLPAGAANERAESAGRDLCTGCRVATRAGCFTVCHSRCPVWSDVADLLTGGPSRLALAQAPVPKVAAAAITGLDITDSRYPIRSQASRPASARWQARGGASAAAGTCSWAWPRSHPLGPLTKGTGGQEPVAPGDTTVWATRREVPDSAWGHMVSAVQPPRRARRPTRHRSLGHMRRSQYRGT